MMDIFTTIGTITSVGAFVVSIISLHRSSKVEKLQNEVSKLDVYIKQYELERIKESQEARVEARLIQEGKYHYLEIKNEGKGTASNIDYSIKGAEEFAHFFKKEKTPFPKLEQGRSYKELVTVCMGFPSVVEIITNWKDAKGNECNKANFIEY